MILLLFLGVAAAQLYEQLNRQASSAFEKSSAATVPSFQSLVEPFVEVLNTASTNGLFCFQYASYNYGLFQQLSGGGKEFDSLWAAFQYSSNVKSAVDAEISAFPDYWNKAYPDVPITFDEANGVYSVCWNKG